MARRNKLETVTTTTVAPDSGFTIPDDPATAPATVAPDSAPAKGKRGKARQPIGHLIVDAVRTLEGSAWGAVVEAYKAEAAEYGLKAGDPEGTKPFSAENKRRCEFRKAVIAALVAAKACSEASAESYTSRAARESGFPLRGERSDAGQKRGGKGNKGGDKGGKGKDTDETVETDVVTLSPEDKATVQALINTAVQAGGRNGAIRLLKAAVAAIAAASK